MKIANKMLIGTLLSLVSAVSVSAVSETTTSPNINAGEQLFRTAGGYGCIACHGLYANGAGNVGGNIRGKTLDDINHSLANEPTMQLLSSALSNMDRLNLAVYLEALGKISLVEWTIEDKATSSTITIESDTPAQLVIFNKLFEPVELTLPQLTPEQTVQLNPYETKAVDWIPSKGVYTLNYNQSQLTIEIK
ncbi:c-type cytochrome [Vibrio ziniensis]|uniref:Cytochrome c n=1 Tax=Vibrio ziniensis TaxID=2711221 RepID=A0A6G7CQE3_9VIBR|nr:cytochrome c [Vibrio ziniensis]QIH44310.1 cytochrome c [Vibrio ziniensis]